MQTKCMIYLAAAIALTAAILMFFFRSKGLTGSNGAAAPRPAGGTTGLLKAAAVKGTNLNLP